MVEETVKPISKTQAKKMKKKAGAKKEVAIPELFTPAEATESVLSLDQIMALEKADRKKEEK